MMTAAVDRRLEDDEDAGRPSAGEFREMALEGERAAEEALGMMQDRVEEIVISRM